jgi:hypothetical protein
MWSGSYDSDFNSMRSLFHTAQPPAICRQARERGLVDDLDPAPHALVAHAAEFMARHQTFASCLETRVEAGNVRIFLLAAIPAKVCLLNPQPALSLCGRNRSFCPISVIAGITRLRCAEITLKRDRNGSISTNFPRTGYLAAF